MYVNEIEKTLIYIWKQHKRLVKGKNIATKLSGPTQSRNFQLSFRSTEKHVAVLNIHARFPTVCKPLHLDRVAYASK